MALGDLTIKEFLVKTASGAAVPGGGSIAALSAAIAASLSEMVANLTLGKTGFEAVQEEIQAVAGTATRYRDRLVKAMDRDSIAFSSVLAAFKLPKHTEGEQKNRKQDIQEALKIAASVPLDVAKDALAIMELAGTVLEKGNKNAVTDGAVAVMMARTAARSALYNVKINLATITDEHFVNQIKGQVSAIETEVERKEKEILSQVALGGSNLHSR
jgi:formiminotetrahydrofolate cyclodeaminase